MTTLADLTTLRVGGPIARLVPATSSDALVDSVAAADAAGGPLLVVGGGSNLLASDAPFEGTVVDVQPFGEVASIIHEDPAGSVVVRAGAGTVWDEFVSWTLAEGLSGVEALIKNGVQLVAEGANMPTTPEAIEALQAAGVAYAPGKASNAGGVATSGLEMQQNSGRTQWAFEETDAKLHQIMVDIHANTVATAEEYGVAGDYVAGANLAGFRKVADAMVAMGLI